MSATHGCGVVSCFLTQGFELIAKAGALATCAGMGRSVSQSSIGHLQRCKGFPYVLPPIPSDFREERVSLADSDEGQQASIAHLQSPHRSTV